MRARTFHCMLEKHLKRILIQYKLWYGDTLNHGHPTLNLYISERNKAAGEKESTSKDGVLLAHVQSKRVIQAA